MLVEKTRKLQAFLSIARGDKPAPLVLKNSRLINVFSGEVDDADVAIANGKIAGVGRYEGTAEIDLKGRFLAPGFIDSHVHIESCKLLPWEYAAAVVPKGTTTVIMDPHEIANVLGLKGIRFFLSACAAGPGRWLDRCLMILITSLPSEPDC